MSDYILKSNKNFSFGPDYKQVYKNKPITTLMHEEIIRMRHNGSITDDDLAIVKFIFEFRFATIETIQKFLKNKEKLNDVEVRLDRLVKNRILNKFALSLLPLDFMPDDALAIYCLDLGGKTLLAQYSKCDVTNWNTTKTNWSSENISYDLVTADFYINLINTVGGKLEYFKSNPEYRINKQLVVPSFEFALTINGIRKYFVGEIVRDFDIPIGFRMKSEKIESILCTKAWMKYFYDAGQNPPVLLLIAENDEVALETGRIISTVSDIQAFRISTDERMQKPLNEGGAFLKYEKEKDILQAIKASTFDPE